MKKSMKGEVVLSSFQVQATRLNKLEYHRLQRNISLLRDDLETHIARIKRQEQGLKVHFTNVVRVIKPNKAYQLWKQAHAHEIAQDQAQELIGLIIHISF
jgi:predicted DsbA family dithiol-disulfide isomerase